MNSSAIPRLAAELVEDRHHLGLRGHVERGRRLVGEQQPRLDEQRRGDHDALQQAAGQLVRVLREAPLAVVDADVGAARRPRGAAPRRARRAVRAQRLGHEVADPADRVHVRARVLEDHRDLARGSARSAPPREREHVAAVEADRAVVCAPGGSSRAIARAVIDLPEPDSPTSPSASPAPIAQRRRRAGPSAARPRRAAAPRSPRSRAARVIGVADVDRRRWARRATGAARSSAAPTRNTVTSS